MPNGGFTLWSLYFRVENFRFVEIFLILNVYGKRSGVRMARAHWLASSPQFLLDPDWKIKVKTATLAPELGQIIIETVAVNKI